MLTGLASETAAFISFFFIIIVFVSTFRHSFRLLIAVVFMSIGILVIYYFLLLLWLSIPSVLGLSELFLPSDIHGFLVSHFGFSFPLTHSLLSISSCHQSPTQILVIIVGLLLAHFDLLVAKIGFS